MMQKCRSPYFFNDAFFNDFLMIFFNNDEKYVTNRQSWNSLSQTVTVIQKCRSPYFFFFNYAIILHVIGVLIQYLRVSRNTHLSALTEITSIVRIVILKDNGSHPLILILTNK